MKRHFTALLLVVVAFLAAGGLTSCDDYDDWGWYDGPTGDYFYDSDLDGAWELVQADGIPVGSGSTNYLDFYGDGHGMYYYYDNGTPVSERMGYFCQYSNNGASRYQVNVRYEYGQPTTMNYWFAGGSLWMQWRTGGGRVVTYVYRPVSYVPW